MKKTDHGSLYTRDEIKVFRKLNTPQKIQDYLNAIPFNFDPSGSYLSPRKVLERGIVDCLEGALFAAAVLEFYGHKPLLLDLRATTKPYDYDHILAVFKIDGHFGAISKTNHSVLRYREPIYKSVRELSMTFFHEYFLEDGRKTLREYSDLLDLSKLKLNWRTGEESLWELHDVLDSVKHHKILTAKQIKNLRKVDAIEIRGSYEDEYEPPETIEAI